MRSSRREDRRHRRLLRQMDRSARAARRRAEPGASFPAASLVVVLLAALTGGVLLSRAGWDPSALLQPRVYIEVDGGAAQVPRAEASDGRLLSPVPVTTEGAYAFLHVHDDASPVGYDPCRPIRYVVNPAGMPQEGEQLIADAIAIVSDASGLQWEYLGVTEEPPDLERALIQPERYGHDWAPVLIAWADEAGLPELAGEVAGLGGSAAVPGEDGTGQWLAAGRVVLDRDGIGALLAGHGGYPQARAVVVHELAHVLGLDHVDDVTELMHPMTSNRVDLGPGDRAGLALVGQSTCQ